MREIEIEERVGAEIVGGGCGGGGMISYQDLLAFT